MSISGATLQSPSVISLYSPEFSPFIASIEFSDITPLTTLLKPFLRFQRCVHNSCPRFQSVLVRLSQSLRGQSVPLIRLECVVIFGHSLLNTTPSQWLVYISPASLLFFLRLLFSERYRRSEADILYETAACSFPRVGCLIILPWYRETVRGVL